MALVKEGRNPMRQESVPLSAGPWGTRERDVLSWGGGHCQVARRGPCLCPVLTLVSHSAPDKFPNVSGPLTVTAPLCHWLGVRINMKIRHRGRTSPWLQAPRRLPCDPPPLSLPTGSFPGKGCNSHGFPAPLRDSRPRAQWPACLRQRLREAPVLWGQGHHSRSASG